MAFGHAGYISTRFLGAQRPPIQQRVVDSINQADRLIGTLFLMFVASRGARLVLHGYLQSTGNQSIGHETIHSTNHVVPCTTTKVSLHK